MITENYVNQILSYWKGKPLNLLSLNLLKDIITDQRDIQGAKIFHAQTAEMFMKHNITSPYIEGLLFPKQYNTADPGIIYFNRVR